MAMSSSTSIKTMSMAQAHIARLVLHIMLGVLRVGRTLVIGEAAQQ